MKKFLSPKRKISQLNIGEIDPNPEHADYTLVYNNASWVLPQILAFVGTRVPIRKGEGDLYSFKNTLTAIKQAVDTETLLWEDYGDPVTSQEMLGILSIFRAAPRGKVLGLIKQSSPEGLRYSAGVPLFCSALKEYRDIKYSSWNWNEPERRFFLDQDMLDYSEFFDTDFSETFPTKKLLEYRDCALQVKSGAKAGSHRPPEGTTSVYGVKDDKFIALPRLLKLALTQLWVFSPVFDSPYIITNPTSLDDKAEPLIVADVYKKNTEVSEKSKNVPW